jgi:solute carrier family 35 protein F5
VLYLVPVGIKWVYLKRQKKIEMSQLEQTSQEEDETLIKMAAEGRSEVHEYVRSHKNPNMATMLKSTLVLQTMTEEVNEVLAITWQTAVLWIGTNFCYNYGLMYSSITTNMVLNNSCPMWIWLLSLSPIIPAAHREQFSLLKAMMLWLLMLGFAIISYQDVLSTKESTRGTILGNTSALMSAVLYAVYSLYLKISVREERQDSFRYTYLLGFIGLFNLIVLLPVLLFLHAKNIETFNWPDGKIWGLLMLNAFLANFLWDYCFLKAVSLLGPLITNTGLCLSFPLSLLIDMILYKLQFTWMYLFGSACVIAAFSVIMYADREKAHIKEKLSVE